MKLLYELSPEAKPIKVNVSSGICGFTCSVEALKQDARTMTVNISGSGCQQVQKLAALIIGLSLMDIFRPISKNPVYVAAEQAKCHPTCPVPMAVLKTAEAAMGAALPKDVQISFSLNN